MDQECETEAAQTGRIEFHAVEMTYEEASNGIAASSLASLARPALLP